MKKFIVLLTVITLLFSCKSNYTKIGDKDANYIPYYLKIYEADSLFLTNNYQRSYEILDSLFINYEPINIEGYYEYGNYLASCIKTNNIKNLQSKIKKAYCKYGGISIFHPNFVELKKDILLNSKFSNKQLDRFKKIYQSNINFELRKKIEKMCREDQEVRDKMIEDSIIYFQNKHEKELDYILKTYKYPSKKLIGYSNLTDNSVDLVLIFIHQSIQAKEKYLKLMFDNLKKGNCTPYEYATVYDKKKIIETKSNGSKQYFGTFINYKGNIDPPLINQNKIDSIRNSIGLFNKTYNNWRASKMIE